MKQGKRVAYVLLVAVLVSVFAWLPMKTEAGTSEMVLDASTLGESEWSNPEDDVTISENRIVFSKDSTEYTRYISKAKAEADERFANVVSLSATVTFTKMPAGKSFVFGFGLSSIEVLQGEAENIEVIFTNNGGIKAGVTVYDEEGTPQTVAKPKACGISLNKAAKVNVTISTDSKITVSVNGKTVCTGTLPVNGEGRVGFLQTGKCGVEIADLEVRRYKYDTPENTNIDEDFEKGTFDASKLTSRAIDMFNIWPRGQMIEDYNGSKVFMYKQVGMSYLGTLYQYSNFEMTFDVPYMDIVSEYDPELGAQSKFGHKSFMISIGGENADWDVDGYSSAIETLVYSQGAIYSRNNPETLRGELKKDPWAENGRPFSVKVSVVDSVVTAGIKWLEEKEFQTVLTYRLKNGTPQGYLHIWTSDVGNWAIDNLKITNLDDNANVIETEYKSGKWDRPEDAVYEPMKRVYNDEDDATQANGKLLNGWYLMIPVVAVIGGVAVAITAIVTKKKVKKEATKHES